MCTAAYTAEHLPGVRESLRRGATRRQIEHVEQQLGFTFPPAFRMLYSIHNGQSWLEDPSHQTHPVRLLSHPCLASCVDTWWA